MIPTGVADERVRTPRSERTGAGGDRASSPVVGVVLLVAITVIAAATVGLAASATPPDPAPTTVVGVSVDAGAERISLTHEGGDPIDLAATEIKIAVDGEALAHQPPVPFFAATGFESGPTGPFNTASPDRWRSGETGSLTLASTNEPGIEPGSTVTVEIVGENRVIATAETTA